MSTCERNYLDAEGKDCDIENWGFNWRGTPYNNWRPTPWDCASLIPQNVTTKIRTADQIYTTIKELIINTCVRSSRSWFTFTIFRLLRSSHDSFTIQSRLILFEMVHMVFILSVVITLHIFWTNCTGITVNKLRKFKFPSLKINSLYLRQK